MIRIQLSQGIIAAGGRDGLGCVQELAIRRDYNGGGGWSGGGSMVCSDISYPKGL